MTTHAAAFPRVRFLSELKRRNVFRVAATYLGASWLVVHVGTVLGESFVRLHRVMPMVIFVLAAGLPIVLVAAWCFERTAQGVRLTRHVEPGQSIREHTARKLDGFILLLIAIAILALLADRWLLHRPTEQSMLGLLAVMVVVLLVDRLVPRADARGAGFALDRTAAASSNDAVAKPRLAVLPFENLSPDPTNAFFTDGLHEEILSTLARRASGLEVISRTTMMGYRRDPKPLAVITKELSATHALEGSVRREQDQVRVTLQLIDARTDGHVWSRNYDRTLAKALTLQADVASEVAAQLSVHFAGNAQHMRSPTQCPEAYDLYLKARLAVQLTSPFAAIESYQHIEALLSSALQHDPSFALAYAERASLRMLLFAFNFDASEAQARRAREDIEAARRVTPDDPLVWALEAQYLSLIEQDHVAALVRFRAAETAGVTDAGILIAASYVLFRTSHVEESLRLDERIMALDPGNPLLANSLWVHALRARKPAVALRMLEPTIERFPGFLGVRYARARVLAAYGRKLDDLPATRKLVEYSADSDQQVAERFHDLLLEQRFTEIKAFLSGISASAIRTLPPGYGVGYHPVAHYRGWVDLLLGDAEGAASAGRAVLDFVGHQAEMKWNRWFLRSLEAEGHAFSGHKERAVATAREALAMTSRASDFFSWYPAAEVAARVFAWCGAEDPAVELLEQLATGTSGAPPADIAGNPLFSIPLATNRRFQQLVLRLEAEMRATRLE